MATIGDVTTPRRDGFRMPAEWEPHEACLMEWPTITRGDLWADRFEEAKRDYAAVANAIAAFEPVVMVCDTEQCLLHPNRKPQLTREQIEEGLRDYLGADTIVWLGNGHSTDRDTDGHIDGIVIYAGPATVALLAPTDPSDPDHVSGRDNADRLAAARDARGRPFEVIPFETTPPGVVPYLNVYLANGGAIVPVADRPEDEQALERIAKLFPDREIVAVPGNCLTYGGGGAARNNPAAPRGGAGPPEMGPSPTEEERAPVFT